MMGFFVLLYFCPNSSEQKTAILLFVQKNGINKAPSKLFCVNITLRAHIEASMLD